MEENKSRFIFTAELIDGKFVATNQKIVNEALASKDERELFALLSNNIDLMLCRLWNRIARAHSKKADGLELQTIHEKGNGR